ncbi:uncharacterized protein K452DRAFT_306031 [Aplosporella prunicola CBS 121167]|uniref:Uncharacterized protein n=1 Tax=Aplosporella prunicola CBS 121167 TaxID=1176127 RepID=A0A6A6BPA4_9PEZI|nr:uncharacterized protein K452DRAFT_306031 [Aplosporella prunicola CBS 121167]KAF2145095.1 hypothetical protein K452DRAFT_306031 [Aplosporella prunicola CBS 121167]
MLPGHQPPNMRFFAPTPAALNGAPQPTYSAPKPSTLPGNPQKIYISGVHNPQPLQHARAWFATGRYLYTGPTAPAVPRSLHPAADNTLIPSHDPHHPPVWDPADVRFRVGFVPKYDELNGVKALLKLEAKRGNRVEELTAAHEDARGALSRRALRNGADPGVGGGASRLQQQRAGNGGYVVVEPMPPVIATQQHQQGFAPERRYCFPQMQTQQPGWSYAGTQIRMVPSYQTRPGYQYQFHNNAASFQQSGTNMDANRHQFQPYHPYQYPQQQQQMQQQVQQPQRQFPPPQNMVPFASYDPQPVYAQPRASHPAQPQARQFAYGLQTQAHRPNVQYQAPRGGATQQTSNNNHTGRAHPGAPLPASVTRAPLPSVYCRFPF